MMKATTIRILIVDDHVLVRRGMIALLGDRSDISIVGEASDGLEAIGLAATLSPDVILMDLDLPRLNGVTAIKMIKEKYPACRILVVTSFDEKDLVIAAIEGGANGYLLKTTMPENLLSAIQEVHQGGAPLDPAIAGILLRRISGIPEQFENDQYDLTVREITVLKKLAKGYSDRKIAASLSISVRTVSTHVHSILTKLAVENRTQAVLYALRSGIADLAD